ncbi:MAG: hypothetical protein RIQ54_444, partial [Candidatus Parcubacteria bacterium]
YKEDIENLFPNCMVTFRSPAELLERADYFLKNPQEREKIAEKSYQYALQHHTFRHRGQVIIEIIKNSMEHKHSYRDNSHAQSRSDEFNAGERYYPGETIIDEYALKEHTHRYGFAASHLPQNATVLDAACGTGYGSKILAQKASKVCGMDISNHAIEWGKKQFENNKVSLAVGSLNEKLPFADKTFDAITSFETIEHVEDQENMLSEFRRVLKDNGVFFISSPNREIITEKAHTENHFHINELSKQEFIEKIEKYFEIKELFGQTKYAELSSGKKIIKSIIKIVDPLKLRRKIIKALNLQLFLHKNFSPMEQAIFDPITKDAPTQYYVTVAVCMQKK